MYFLHFTLSTRYECCVWGVCCGVIYNNCWCRYKRNGNDDEGTAGGCLAVSWKAINNNYLQQLDHQWSLISSGPLSIPSRTTIRTPTMTSLNKSANVSSKIMKYFKFHTQNNASHSYHTLPDSYSAYIMYLPPVSPSLSRITQHSTHIWKRLFE